MVGKSAMEARCPRQYMEALIPISSTSALMKAAAAVRPLAKFCVDCSAILYDAPN